MRGARCSPHPPPFPLHLVPCCSQRPGGWSGGQRRGSLDCGPGCGALAEPAHLAATRAPAAGDRPAGHRADRWAPRLLPPPAPSAPCPGRTWAPDAHGRRGGSGPRHHDPTSLRWEPDATSVTPTIRHPLTSPLYPRSTEMRPRGEPNPGVRPMPQPAVPGSQGRRGLRLQPDSRPPVHVQRAKVTS